MIHVIDKASVGKIHVMYNVAVLHILRIAYPNEKIIFYGEAEHVENVEGKVSHLSNIEIRSLSLKSSPSANPIKRIWSLFLRIRSDKHFFRNLMTKVKNTPDDWIFLCTASSLSFLSFVQLKKRFPDIRVVATLHGELEYLYYKHSRREEGIGRIYRKILTAQSPHLAHLVLNKISKQKIVNDGYVPAHKVIEIDHPYVFQSMIQPPRNFKGGLLKIGHVGSMGVRKNAHLLYKLASLLRTSIEDMMVEIHSIGAIESDILPYRNNLVLDGYDPAIDNAQYLSREEFESKISNLHYALFFYNEEQFILRASGAIFDVITYTKPIIVLKHPYFDYLFREAGNIGHVCNSLEDMATLITELSALSSSMQKEYNIQMENIRQYQQKISLNSIADDFKKQFEQLN